MFGFFMAKHILISHEVTTFGKDCAFSMHDLIIELHINIKLLVYCKLIPGNQKKQVHERKAEKFRTKNDSNLKDKKLKDMQVFKEFI
ncbi:CLUMA_CG005947, isoform A [Clunio marinus]|uniref:CLUMA_CG005947, isoform A n=1 Tax=Clunio marinus TaxID=568069 RepID=A0A1J1HWJ5_9DIPT|nr:CLUMA_CG005947, isoform A [Clunio marinus]